MSVTLSIITINYNNADGLRKTMQSVLDQDYSDFEYLVIDGGSTDGSKEVIEDFLNNHPNSSKITYWCSEKDGGIYPAMNKGIAHALGQHIGILNSGDVFCKNVLDIVGECAVCNTDKILYGCSALYKGEEFDYVYGPNHIDICRNMIPHESAFVPKSVYEKYGTYDETYKIAADYEAFIRYYLAGVEFQFIDLLVGRFYQDGISSTNEKLLYEENKRLRKAHGIYVNPRKQFFVTFLPRLGRYIKKIIKG